MDIYAILNITVHVHHAHFRNQDTTLLDMEPMSSGWFDCTEPSLSTLLQGKQGVQGAYALVRGGSSILNPLEPHHHRDSKVWRVLSHEFGVVRLYLTFSIYIVAGETRSAGCLCTSSGCFKHIEPHRTF